MMSILDGLGFTFNGVHTSEHGLFWVQSEKTPVSAKITRNTYNVAGRMGPVLMDGERYAAMEISGALYWDTDPTDRQDAYTKMDAIKQWLLAGAKTMVFDAQPNRTYTAYVADALEFDLKTWFGGGINVKFMVSPYSYTGAWTEDTIAKDQGPVAVTKSFAPSFLHNSGNIPSPVGFYFVNTGRSEITRIDITIAGKTLSLQNLTLWDSDTAGTYPRLDVRMDPFDVWYTNGAATYPAFSSITAIDDLRLQPGNNSGRLTVYFGSRHTTSEGTLCAATLGIYVESRYIG